MALLASIAIAGCGTEPRSDEAGDASDPSASSSDVESTSPEPESPTAVDGTDYAACDDGSCEVLVTGEVQFSFDDFTLTVTITDDGIETHTANSDNTRSGSSNMSGAGISDAYCVAYLTAGSNTMQCYPDTEPGEAPAVESESGVLVLEMLDFLEGTAVIRLTMG
ncbi:hypothetical protein [Glycomyces harbinensis]|uniref:Uncharacterized protein n=1 Tax=Glycomyces harbinensis TaxID=58114 RepID=A0A1G6ZDN4_9ACTN|nr:hypothetical protein [Glycomyces harbinensis]SDE00287.1 hypothetical protein SAMN05216270_110175 [Glycomyces harbinensis]